jgi:hypothetical protein
MTRQMQGLITERIGKADTTALSDETLNGQPGYIRITQRRGG